MNQTFPGACGNSKHLFGSRTVLATLGISALIAVGSLARADMPHASSRAHGAVVTASVRYASTRATADGLGKTYMGRQIARVMGWQAANWLERDTRAAEERSELLLTALQLRPGLMVADIGAGTGYYSRPIARQIGPSGQLFAVDVQPQMLRLLQQRAAADGITNIRPVLADLRSVNLTVEHIDLALLVDVYHELEFPEEVLASTVSAMRHGGRVVFVEYRAEDPRVPIKPLHRMSEAQVRKEAAVHGLRWLRTIETLPWQHILIFTRP